MRYAQKVKSATSEEEIWSKQKLKLLQLETEAGLGTEEPLNRAES